jgi:hypothetical protein
MFFSASMSLWPQVVSQCTAEPTRRKQTYELRWAQRTSGTAVVVIVDDVVCLVSAISAEMRCS